MNRPIAIAWGLLSLLPFLYIFYFFGQFGESPPHQSVEEARAQFDRFFDLHLANMGLIAGLLVAYIVYLFKTPHVPQDKKALWAVVLFLGHIISMPIFWFIYVWQPLQKKRNVT